MIGLIGIIKMNLETFPATEDIDWTEYGREVLSNLSSEYYELFYKWVKKNSYNLYLYENYSGIALDVFKAEHGLK